MGINLSLRGGGKQACGLQAEVHAITPEQTSNEPLRGFLWAGLVEAGEVKPASEMTASHLNWIGLPLSR